MKTIKNWNQFNEGLLSDYAAVVRKYFQGVDTDVDMIADETGLEPSVIIEMIRLDLKEPEIADKLEQSYFSEKGEEPTTPLGISKLRKKTFYPTHKLHQNFAPEVTENKKDK